jgi:hypothetical protein
LRTAGQAARIAFAEAIRPWIESLLKNKIPDNAERTAFAKAVRADLENESYHLYSHL